MALNIDAELKRLGTLATPKLEAAYAEFSSEAAPCNNRSQLFLCILGCGQVPNVIIRSTQ